MSLRTGCGSWPLYLLSLASMLVGFTEPDQSLAAPPVSPIRILVRHCLHCHDGPEAKAGLDLTSLGSILRGGDHGPAITLGNSAESLLIQRVTEGSMPPIGDGDPLSEAELSALSNWIDRGAAWPADLILHAPASAQGRPAHPQPDAAREFSAARPEPRWQVPPRSTVGHAVRRARIRVLHRISRR